MAFSHISLIQKEYNKMEMILVVSKKVELSNKPEVTREHWLMSARELCVPKDCEKESLCCNYVHNFNCNLAESDCFCFVFKQWSFTDGICSDDSCATPVN